MTVAFESERPEVVRFQDPEYRWWSVHEVRDPVSPTGFALLFVSEEGFRRVRDYPADWRTLGGERLWSLSWKR